MKNTKGAFGLHICRSNPAGVCAACRRFPLTATAVNTCAISVAHPFALTREQIAIGYRAEKARKRAAKAAERAAKAAEKAAADLRTEMRKAAEKAFTAERERERAAQGAANRAAKRAAKREREKTRKVARQSAVIALRRSQERGFSVAVSRGCLDVEPCRVVDGTLARIDGRPFPARERWTESKAARRARLADASIIGKTADGSLPALTFGDAERIAAGVRAKVAPRSVRRA
jgi:hypothetical protein